MKIEHFFTITVLLLCLVLSIGTFRENHRCVLVLAETQDSIITNYNRRFIRMINEMDSLKIELELEIKKRNEDRREMIMLIDAIANDRVTFGNIFLEDRD